MTDADPSVSPVAPVAGRRWNRFILPAVAIVAIGLTLVFALQPGIDALRTLLPLFHGAAIGWAFGAIGCQALMYIFISGVLRAGLGAASDEFPAIPTLTLAACSAAFLWANRALPGPAVAGLATLVFLLGRRGVSAAVAQGAAATFYVADYVAFAPMCLIVILLLSQFSHLAGLHSGAMFIALAIVGAGMVVSVLVLKSPRNADRLAGHLAALVSRVLRHADRNALSVKARLGVSQFYERWDALTARPGPLIVASCCSLLAHLAEIATIFCAVCAFSTARLDTVGACATLLLSAATSFVAGNLAAIVSFLPAGLGFFEGAMITSLHLVGGLSVAEAALATVLYRLISVWLPLPFVLRTARHAVAMVSAVNRKTVSE